MRIATRGGALALGLCLVIVGTVWGQAQRYFGVLFAPELLQSPPVAAELKLTEIQKRRIGELRQQQRAPAGSRGASLAGKSPEEQAAIFDEAQEAANERAVAILDPRQAKRFREICLQVRGLPALAMPDVAAELKLTNAQQGRLVTIGKEQLAAMQKLSKGGGAGGPSLSSNLEAVQRETNNKLEALLTDEQKARWKAMQGIPFAMPKAPR